MTLMRLSATVSLVFTATACGQHVDMPTRPTPVTAPAPALEPAMAPPPLVVPPAAAETARYTVTFESTWSASTHPTDFPDDAHYSGVIGGTHDEAVIFWREGALATEGIRRMAERGGKAPLDDEVNVAIAGGRAEHLLSGGAIGRSPGAVSLEFDISRRFPLVTIVTMVAPSPDWFTGVTGLPLFVNDDWVSALIVDMVVYDAGTDSGVTYRSADQETLPRQPIRRLIGYPVGTRDAAAPFGRITFRRH